MKTDPFADDRQPKKKKKKRKKAPSPPPNPPAKTPFRILGLGDDGQAYFVGIHNRLQSELPKRFGKGFLLTLAPVDWWNDNFAIDGRMKWDNSTSFIMDAALNSDFDPSFVRGRGAWRECDGRICYHDGQFTIGEKNPNRLYLRKTRVDIGLNNEPAKPELCQAIVDNVSKLSFSSQADKVRIMGWTALAPFAGALQWRPCGLITGPSKSGKSTIVNYIVRKIALPSAFSGGTTEAAIRQAIANDSCAIVIEESEKDTKKKKQTTEDLFSLMRMSTSDDAPIIAKGTKEGRAQIFRMNNMFLFVAIDPTVGNVADENRIFRVEMTKPTEDQKSLWRELSSNISNLTTPKNCAAIRSLTWKKLPEILRYAEYLEPIIRGETGRDNRFSYAEGLLLSAYWLIWRNVQPLEEEAVLGVRQLYEMQPIESGRDETLDMVDRILSESVRCEIPIGLDNQLRQPMTLGQMLATVYCEEYDGTVIPHDGRVYLRNLAGQYGVGVTTDGFLAIANNHHKIKQIIERTSGYHRQLQRHDGLVEKNKRCLIAGRTTVCTILKGCLEVEK